MRGAVARTGLHGVFARALTVKPLKKAWCPVFDNTCLLPDKCTEGCRRVWSDMDRRIANDYSRTRNRIVVKRYRIVNGTGQLP